ncbi:MAG TPA: TIM barrel protein [Oscillospiraceae bacterium]|nr:TIM barrel protein [Oscillospiraceae bacterium]HPS35799.1 TIM barrel protein [Oscillospiraceae bacterium]
MQLRIGPAGGCDEFAAKYKSNLFLPEFISDFGLNAFEYQCGRGVNLAENAAEVLHEKTAAIGMEISLHAPYYISLSGIIEEKRLKSVYYILLAAQAVKKLGGTRIVVHAGSASKISRAHAVELAKDTLIRAQKALDETGMSDVVMCPETLGKVNQLGTVEEICELCKIDERLLPCIDFGHVNAMTNGSVKTKDDYLKILRAIENSLGSDRLKRMHIHFSKIEYTLAGGEQRHLTFSDSAYGPEFEPLAELIVQKDMTPYIVCESAGTQTRDAATMFKILKEKCEHK